MNKAEILQVHQRLIGNSDPTIYTQPILENPFERSGARPNSIYIGDTAFGDSGKGIVTAEFNRMMVDKFGVVYSLRFNGGANAGHHMWIDGTEFLANQLPAAVAQEKAIALITRGVVFHPGDAVIEIERTKQTFGGEMPGELLIDANTPLCLDTHRALDIANGSTGRGIGPAYSDFYGRRGELTVADLISSEWKLKLGEHYDQKKGVIAVEQKKLMRQKGIKGISNLHVKRLDNSTVALGTKKDFLNRLGASRQPLLPFVMPEMAELLQAVWAGVPDIPVTIEEAQGPGLDPYFGIRPDVTSSRPSSRFVQDGTYGKIFGEDIALKLGVSKTVYMSSVGARWLPGEMSKEEASFYQEGYGERGKTTGRLRGIYHLSLPIITALRRFANYDYLVATHLDASRNNMPVRYVSHHTNSSDQEVGYSPYQTNINGLTANLIELPGWDGNGTRQAKTPTDLDDKARLTLTFLSQTIAPVLMARTGQELGQNIKWWEC
jgi:adenylosuccinate synthase